MRFQVTKYMQNAILEKLHKFVSKASLWPAKPTSGC